MVDRPSRLITLGSASPRRAALLETLGVDFVVDTVDLDERGLLSGSDGDPETAVVRIAAAKFAAFPAVPTDERKLLTADTLVACGGAILGKPQSTDHLASMLHYMSGRDLTITTAVCVGDRGTEPALMVVRTGVTLRDIAAHEIGAYVATGVGMDKAAGLALQAEAGPFIRNVDGCWANVLGLPVCAVSVMLGFVPGDVRPQPQRCSVELCGTSER